MNRIYFILTIFVFLFLFCPDIYPLESALQYLLPIKEDNCRYFFYHNKTLYMGDHEERTMYYVDSSNKLQKVQDMKGWYTKDAVWYDGKILYCSRDRVLFKDKNQKIQTITIPGTQNLFSITTDGKNIYLLDYNEKERYDTLVIVDNNYTVKKRITLQGDKHKDCAWYDGYVWIFDGRDKCVHRLSVKDGNRDLSIQTGVGSSNSRGIVFIEGKLYVHDQGNSLLQYVDWYKKGNAVYSWEHNICYEFIQKSKNISKDDMLSVEYRVPVISNVDSYDYEFMFGLPGYLIQFSHQGHINYENEGLGTDYSIFYNHSSSLRECSTETVNTTPLNLIKKITISF